MAMKLFERALMEAKTREQRIKIQRHILDHFDSYDDMLEQLNALSNPFRELVEGGAFLCYVDDAREFLCDVYGTTLEQSKKYSDDVVWDRYVALLAIELSNIEANPNGGGSNYIAKQNNR
jgi:hypothetical protein